MNFSAIRRPIVFLGGIGLLVFGFLSLELFCVVQTKRCSDALLNQDLIQRQENERMRAEIRGIKAIQPKISAMFVRLNDALFIPRIVETGQGSARTHMRSPNGDERPSAIQMMADAGVVIHPARLTPGEASSIFEAGSSRLEFQRLIPLLAEQENSNAFLYFDRLFLNRPAAIPPFSEAPTYIEARFSIRMLATR
jgi:hypothetical protein